MGLRQQVLRGGAYLILRQGAGMVIGVIGILLLTRIIGPTNYGLYTGALAFVSVLTLVGHLGVEVYLVRREQPPEPAVYHQAFTLLLVAGVVLTGIPEAASFLLAGWLGDPRFIAPLQVLLLGLPLSLLCLPAYAALERELNYRVVALLELGGQISFYAVSLTLAVMGLGVWAPVAGYLAWQGWHVAASYTATRFRPRLVWSSPLLREILGYGLGYSASMWLWQMRILVNPVIVGGFLGAAAVGQVSLALRVVEVLSFVGAATWRLSIAALAKVQGEYAKLRRVMEEAMALQVLGVAPLLALGSAALWILPKLLGERWEPILIVYPFLALGSVINSVFNMHSSVLYVLGRNRKVALFHFVHLALLAGASLLLVPTLGILGFGLAEMVALAGYAVIHTQVTRIFPVSYRQALPRLVALVPPVFAVLLPPPWGLVLFLSSLIVILSPNQRQQIGEYVKSFRVRMA
jgi:O-antigen/teichoic acid export membrane protein